MDDVRDPIHRVKTGRVCEGMPRSKRSGVRPISRWRTFGSGHAEETCRSRIFHSDKSEKTCRSRIFHSDKSEKTCRSRIFHSDQSEKTCRSRIFHSDQSEKTCRSRIFPSAVVKRPADRGTFPPAESLNKLRSRLGPCQHCNDGPFRRFRPRQASRIAQIRSRRSLLHSSRRVRGGRFCTRVAESVTVGHVVSKPLGSPVGLVDVRDPIHRVKTGRVCEECPGQNARCAADWPDRGPLARATLKRPADRGSFTRTRVKRPADRGSFTRTRVKRPADRGSFTRTRVKRPADRGSFPQAVVKRPADRGTFPPAESLNKLSFSSWTVPAL